MRGFVSITILMLEFDFSFLTGGIRKYSSDRNASAECVGSHSNGEQGDKRKCNRAFGESNLLMSHIARRFLVMILLLVQLCAASVATLNSLSFTIFYAATCVSQVIYMYH